MIAEDVVTTGKSTNEVARLLEGLGAKVLAVVSLIDRTGGQADLSFPNFALLPVTAATYAPDDCPLCRAGIPVVKPGSRPKSVFLNLLQRNRRYSKAFSAYLRVGCASS